MHMNYQAQDLADLPGEISKPELLLKVLVKLSVLLERYFLKD